MVLIGTLLVHGVLLFFLPSLLFSPSTANPPPLLVQLLEFSPTLPSAPPSPEPPISAEEPQARLTNVSELQELPSDEPPPSPLPKESFSTEHLVVKPEASPQIEEVPEETLEKEALQELPTVIPVAQERLTIEPEVPELKPEETLNTLIQEKELEQLSMKLTKAAQKPASAQQQPPSLEGLPLSEAELPQSEIESAPLPQSDLVPQAPTIGLIPTEILSNSVSELEQSEVTEPTEIKEIQTQLPDWVIPQVATIPQFKEKPEILQEERDNSLPLENLEDEKYVVEETQTTSDSNPLFESESKQPPSSREIKETFVISENANLLEAETKQKLVENLQETESPENAKEKKEKIIQRVPGKTEESRLSEFGEISAENKTASEVAMLEPRKKMSPQTAESQGKSALPENYFLNPNRQQQLESQNSSSPSQARLAKIPALGNFSSSLLSPGTGKKPSLHPQPRISVGLQNSSGMSYGLNDYHWPYESYMGRWAKAILYSWSNHPPQDYITGRVPAGGNIFVLATLNRKGELISYEVTQVENASELMVTSVLDAIQGATHLPPLPPDFKKQELQAHFKFIYPSIHHLLRRNRR